jgi:tRNA uridine 5-carboxymethylaminomethyl modification enzyme
VDEPYRIFTSRAESRLTLRHDNADQRLAFISKEIGLILDCDWQKFNQKQYKLANLRNILVNTYFKRSEPSYASLSKFLECDLGDRISLAQLSKRQGVNSELILKLLPDYVSENLKISEMNTALADLLYNGYIENQKLANERINNSDNLKIPEKINFRNVNGLSNEMLERLERTSPKTFGQIRSISGITPSALSALLVYLTSQNTKKHI